MRFTSALLTLVLVISNGTALPEVDEPLMNRKVDTGLTVEQFDGYVNLLQMFKDMLPKDLMNTLESLNGGEKGEVIALITNWFQGNVKKPENREEVAQFLKDNLPSVSTKIEKLNATFYEKFDKLKPKTQEMLRLWRDKAVNITGSSTGEAAARQLQLMREFGLAVQTLDPETKEDLRSQFPTAVKLTEGLGFTVITTIMMIGEKIADSLTPLSTVAPIMDCPVE
ncbi:unnamed protein product [Auanema sp. JU1783]|nr:unnamed protein product [Auanema sp. JU1783]